MTSSEQAAARSWAVLPEQPRVIVDSDGRIVGVMDDPAVAALVVQVMTSADADARGEVTVLR